MYRHYLRTGCETIIDCYISDQLLILKRIHWVYQLVASILRSFTPRWEISPSKALSHQSDPSPIFHRYQYLVFRDLSDFPRRRHGLRALAGTTLVAAGMPSTYWVTVMRLGFLAFFDSATRMEVIFWLLRYSIGVAICESSRRFMSDVCRT